MIVTTNSPSAEVTAPDGVNKPLKATILITTKNRKSELATALRSAVLQVPKVEIIVIDDGSTDGTAEMVSAEFPEVIVHRRRDSLGCVARRNEGATLAAGDVIVSIDDDAEFTAPDTVAQTLLEFSTPAIGAVAMPYIDVRKSDRVNQQAPEQSAVWITYSYIGTAHAVRKDVFLALGGYREDLVHQGEEMDFCVRMLDAGYFVRLGNASPIHHHESERRDFSRMDRYGARNAILFAWRNCPMITLPVHLGGTTMKVLLWTLDPPRLRLRAAAVIEGFLEMARKRRQPVRFATYRLFRRLKRGEQLRLDSGVLAAVSKSASAVS
jgi:GT2 family glycosyltransferase